MAVTEYTWNPLTDSVIEETDGAGNVLVEYTNEPAPYGPLISECRDTETRQYHFDALGSTRALTDDGQAVTDTFSYDAWGGQVATAGTTATVLLWNGLVGYHAYSPLQNYFVRARIYSQRQSRWLTIDPLTPDFAYYGYSANSPVTLHDPSGLAVECNGRPQGVQNALTRGKFTLATISPTFMGNAYPISSVTTLHWRQDDSLSFNSEKDGCCCCESVGFIQIAKQTVLSNMRFLDWAHSHDWKIDSDDLFYPYPESGNSIRSCPPYPPGGANPPTVQLVDNPLVHIMPINPFLTLWLVKQEFETCVACHSGAEGLVTKTHLFERADVNFVRGVTIYGCIKWSHTWFHKQRSVRIDGDHKIVRDSTDEASVANYPGNRPSPEFVRTVLAHYY